MDLRETLIRYFITGMTYKEIQGMMRALHMTDISVTQIKRIFRENGLTRRNCISDINSIIDYIAEQLNNAGSMHGYRWMHSKCIANGFLVTREIIRLLMKILDPVGVEFRSQRRFRRRTYSAKGPNYLWHIDGYDKLKPYGICIHGCIDGFSRKIIWVRVNTTNNDPYVIGGYYSDAIREVGGCPCRIRADFGTENRNVEVMQVALRQNAPACFLYGTSTLNQRIESWWGILRKQCIQFWMNCFAELKDNGDFSGMWYEKDLIRICFMTLIQSDVDDIVAVWNNHRVRKGRNADSPGGIPEVIYNTPEQYFTHDYMHEVTVPEIEACQDACVFTDRGNLFQVDRDLIAMVHILMEENEWRWPTDWLEGKELYLELRREMLHIQAMV